MQYISSVSLLTALSNRTTRTSFGTSEFLPRYFSVGSGTSTTTPPAPPRLHVGFPRPQLRPSSRFSEVLDLTIGQAHFKIPPRWRPRWTRSKTLRPRCPRPKRIVRPPSYPTRAPAHPLEAPSRMHWDRSTSRGSICLLTCNILEATSFHLGQLKAKLAKLKRELLNPTTSGGGGAGQGFDVARTGVASIGFIGFPSVGKSTLMSKLTGQHSEAAAYEFTTLTSVPGQVTYNGAPLQMIDLPGIIEGAKDGRGRGRQVIAVAKTCHLIFIVLDVNKPLTDKRVIEAELEGFGIRINKSPPNITVRKKDKGGLNITHTQPLTHIDKDEIKAVMNEYKMSSADITIRCDATIDDLIDVIEAKSRSYIPVIYVLNKIDAISIEELDLLYRIPNAVPISSEQGWNIDELMEAMWEKLKLVRVYTKPKGKMPDYSSPVVLRSTRCTVEDFCNAIHKTIVENFKGALVYGKSVKHQPQRVGLIHELADEDIVTILKR